VSCDIRRGGAERRTATEEGGSWDRKRARRAANAAAEGVNGGASSAKRGRVPARSRAAANALTPTLSRREREKSFVSIFTSSK
jgi:hypothetical protein